MSKNRNIEKDRPMTDGESDIQTDNDTVYVLFCKDISKLNERWGERDVLHGNHHLIPLIYSANQFSLGDANSAFLPQWPTAGLFLWRS